MEKLNLKFIAVVIILFSIMTATIANAAPVRFQQVTQVVNVKPGKANNGNFSHLRLVGDGLISNDPNDPNENDGDKKKSATPQQDDRVITETTSEIVEDEVCDCEEEPEKGGFPKWALLGLGAIPLLFLIRRDKDPTPTPSMTPPMTQTPTMTPTPETPTPTPITPTPTPEEPIPEPMTLLLFGTGLAGIGLAARRKFGKKNGEDEEKEE
ncbi:hypothetical protein BH20ACI4_BH20ACI4_29940 [soil metagenome]